MTKRPVIASAEGSPLGQMRFGRWLLGQVAAHQGGGEPAARHSQPHRGVAGVQADHPGCGMRRRPPPGSPPLVRRAVVAVTAITLVLSACRGDEQVCPAREQGAHSTLLNAGRAVVAAAVYNGVTEEERTLLQYLPPPPELVDAQGNFRVPPGDIVDYVNPIAKWLYPRRPDPLNGVAADASRSLGEFAYGPATLDDLGITNEGVKVEAGDRSEVADMLEDLVIGAAALGLHNGFTEERRRQRGIPVPPSSITRPGVWASPLPQADLIWLRGLVPYDDRPEVRREKFAENKETFRTWLYHPDRLPGAAGDITVNPLLEQARQALRDADYDTALREVGLRCP